MFKTEDFVRGEYESEICRRDRDFEKIREIVHTALDPDTHYEPWGDDYIDALETALRAVRNIVG